MRGLWLRRSSALAIGGERLRGQPGRRCARHRALPQLALLDRLAPGLALADGLLLARALPCLLFCLAFFERGIYGGIDYTFTSENFARALDPLYVGIFLDSARDRR